MTGPEFRWRKRLDVRAERRKRVRQWRHEKPIREQLALMDAQRLQGEQLQRAANVHLSPQNYQGSGFGAGLFGAIFR